MNLLKYCVNQATDIQSQPKKRRRCDHSCSAHNFSLTKIDHTKNNYQAVVNFCPKIPRGNQPPENTYPQFNHDKLYYTDGFILGIDRRELEANRNLEHKQHTLLVKRTCQKNYRVYFPKPNDSHTLCSVCKINYGSQYYAHILSDYHKNNIKENTYNKSIEQLTGRFKHLHPQKTEELTSPFRFPNYIIKQHELEQHRVNPVGLDYTVLLNQPIIAEQVQADTKQVAQQINRDDEQQQLEQKRDKKGKRARKSSKQSKNKQLQHEKIDEPKMNQLANVVKQTQVTQIQTNQLPTIQIPQILQISQTSEEAKEKLATNIEQEILRFNQVEDQQNNRTIRLQVDRIKSMKRRINRYTQKRNTIPQMQQADNELKQTLIEIQPSCSNAKGEELNQNIDHPVQQNENPCEKLYIQNVEQKKIIVGQQKNEIKPNNSDKLTNQFNNEGVSAIKDQQQLNNQQVCPLDSSIQVIEVIKNKQLTEWQKQGISLKQFLQRQIIRKLSHQIQQDKPNIKQATPAIPSAGQIPQHLQLTTNKDLIQQIQDNFQQIQPYQFQIDPDSQQIEEFNRELMKLGQKTQWDEALSYDLQQPSFQLTDSRSHLKRQRDETQPLQQQKLTKRRIQQFKPQSMLKRAPQCIPAKEKVVIEISSSDISSESDSYEQIQRALHKNTRRKSNCGGNLDLAFEQGIFYKGQKRIEQKSPQTWCTTSQKYFPKKQVKFKSNRKNY